jgi:hypothetical protein
LFILWRPAKQDHQVYRLAPEFTDENGDRLRYHVVSWELVLTVTGLPEEEEEEEEEKKLPDTRDNGQFNVYIRAYYEEVSVRETLEYTPNWSLEDGFRATQGLPVLAPLPESDSVSDQEATQQSQRLQSQGYTYELDEDEPETSEAKYFLLHFIQQVTRLTNGLLGPTRVRFAITDIDGISSNPEQLEYDGSPQVAATWENMSGQQVADVLCALMPKIGEIRVQPSNYGTGHSADRLSDEQKRVLLQMSHGALNSRNPYLLNGAPVPVVAPVPVGPVPVPVLPIPIPIVVPAAPAVLRARYALRSQGPVPPT